MDPANPYHDVASDPKWSFSTMSRDFHRIESEGRQLQRKLQGLPEESSCVISWEKRIELLCICYIMFATCFKEKKMKENIN